MIEPLIQSIKYSYRLTFIPKRGRNRRSRTLAAEAWVRLNRAAYSEARPAFRIHLLSAHTKASYEILEVGNRLFWPVVDVSNRRIRVDELLAGLRSGKAATLQHLAGPVIFHDIDQTVEDQHEPNDVEVISNKKEMLLAELQRGAADILLIDDFVYREGGEPLYVRPAIPKVYDFEPYSPPRSNISLLISRLSSIDDKPTTYGDIFVVDPQLRTSTQSLGYISPEVFEYSLLSGAVFRADEIERALALDADCEAKPVQNAKIDILGTTIVRANPIHLQVAQLVRALSRLMKRKEVSAAIDRETVVKFHNLVATQLMSEKTSENTACLDHLAAIDTLWRSPNCQLNSWSEYLACLVDRAVIDINNHCARRNTESLFQLSDSDEASLACI